MNIARALLILLILVIAGCSDTVTRHYPTRAEAEADSLFERGWLPDIIPASSRDITTNNDLDLNLSKGEFFFAPGDSTEFVTQLQGTRDPNRAGSTYSYSDGRSTWVFEVDVNAGHCQYSMGSIPK